MRVLLAAAVLGAPAARADGPAGRCRLVVPDKEGRPLDVLALPDLGPCRFVRISKKVGMDGRSVVIYSNRAALCEVDFIAVVWVEGVTTLEFRTYPGLPLDE